MFLTFIMDDYTHQQKERCIGRHLKKTCTTRIPMRKRMREWLKMDTKREHQHSGKEQRSNDEVRSILIRHWTSLDRSRLHTLHLWLLAYALAQIFLFHYLCHRSSSIGYLVLSLAFPMLVLVCFVLIRYSDEHTKCRLITYSMLSSFSFPVFLLVIHLPIICEFQIKQERVAELSSLCSSLTICTLYQFFVLPRSRRTFLAVSCIINFVSIGLIACVLYSSSSNLAFKESPVLVTLPLLFYQLVVTVAGIVCDSNGSYNRWRISRELVNAVKRRTELENLKNKQEHLLLSVIPAYLADKVSQSIMATSSAADFGKHNKNQKLFHELHVQAHENVSILFADIVNFTHLAAQLSAKDLVRTLNELYSKFDEDAQRLQCMRIKFLGDCYYCVSGMPVNRPNHADMCVLMGLEMIKTIKKVRLKFGVNVDMRIGVHTGSVLCGILGLKKWQFDVWSDDVTFANNMETAGKPGAVHITKKTRDRLIGDYQIIEANSTDPVILAHGQPTYFILPDKATALQRAASIYRNKKSMMEFGSSNRGNERKSAGGLHRAISMKAKMVKMTEFWGVADPIQPNPVRATTGSGTKSTRRNSSTTIERIAEVDDEEQRGATGGSSEGLPRNGIQKFDAAESPSTHRSEDNDEEGELFSSEEDEEFDKNVNSDGLQRRYPDCDSTVQGMTLIENNLGTLSNKGLRTIFYCTLTGGDTEIFPYLSLPFFRKPRAFRMPECRILMILSLPIALANYLLVLQNVPQKVQHLVIGEILLCLFVLLIICIVDSLFKVAKIFFTVTSFGISLFLTIGQHVVLSFLAVVQHRLPVFSILWLPSCITHMCSVFTLYRLPYAMRCFLVSLDCGVFLLLLILFSTSVSNVLQSAPIISCQMTIVLVNIIALFLLLIFIAWITEYERKVEAACDVAFKNEEKDVQLMQDINKLLLDNILPSHVAAKFLSPGGNNPSFGARVQEFQDKLYARDHDNVCVMFASIPNFKDYWSECDSVRKIECLRLLNEIVCEFDKLLSKPKFCCVEKIKTIASTYMAAAGLTDSPETADNNGERNAVTMVEFAQAMAAVLDQLNIDSFQRFELRIGLNVGHVVAGVLGQKPQYDIWGNSVNVASRMDSIGVRGYIQISEETKQVLSRRGGYSFECRGEINVKGKGLMTTYLIKLIGKSNRQINNK